MYEDKIKLLERAVEDHKTIYPCGFKNRLSDCFTEEGDNLMFWFNTEDKSTHIVVDKVSKIN